MKKHNFSAGPAILPAEVLTQAASAVTDLDGIGLSLLEISHRSPEFKAILEEATALPKELLHIPETHEVLYLPGGASSQFFMAAMNLLAEDGLGAYIDTGSWSAKAIKEAKAFGPVEVVASSKDKNYTYIPKGYQIPQDATYLHVTSNNTIFGTQFSAFPETNIPMVADMSSDIFSRPLDVSRFGIIYAGAQKNLGPAGTTLVIIHKDMLGKVKRAIPTMLNYQTHIDKGSAFNTPPVFPIYVCLLTLRWIAHHGGVSEIQKSNASKATKVYEAIDRNPLFRCPVPKEDRSQMNAVFVTQNSEHESLFLEKCKANNISGIKGHRSVGGFRASIYNAMPMESIDVLVEVMDDFANKHG
ncbi:MAG: 3-phosphoserine/phosphohydroxythreonine transaminase [Saprospiraceae bacterium]|nr:3-phosphoserine/phosphohydroxythreonine transaminase [Saprospiraceae bacterium]